jgi:hypothetical protein
VVAAVEAMTSRLVTLQPVAQLTTLVGLQPQQLAALLALHEQGRLLPLLEQAAGLARQPPGQGPQLINRVDVYRRQLQVGPASQGGCSDPPAAHLHADAPLALSHPAPAPPLIEHTHGRPWGTNMASRQQPSWLTLVTPADCCRR